MDSAWSGPRAPGRRPAGASPTRSCGGQTGRSVLNDIRAGFRFADGLIAEHRDDFDFYRWARQALGPVGLLGWTPFVRSAVRRRAAARLDAFTAQPGRAGPERLLGNGGGGALGTR